MSLHKLTPAEGSVKSKKRIARGTGSGHGGTATRGHKGAKSISGYNTRRAFEGGQMPLQMRLPKVGFKSPHRIEYYALNLDKVQSIVEQTGLTEINLTALYQLRIIKKGERVKLLGNGDVTGKVNISVNACSATAKEKVESKGGVVNIV